MKIKLIISAFLLSCSITVSAQKSLTILHANDTHSCIMPLNPNLSDTLVAGRGGFIRRIALLEEERTKDPDLLMFDSGDFSQGSPYYTLFKGDVEVELMNQMHIDACTIGNHEFDYGLENLARLFRKANFPIVCSNYDVTNTPLEGLVKPYLILKRKGIKIGVFALSPKLEDLVDKKNYQNIKYLDPIATAQNVATLLKKQKKCDLVVLISHLGWEEKGMGDQLVISQTRDIDLVLGGHSHTFFNTLRYVKNMDGNPVAVDQNGKQGIFIGKMKLDFKRK